MGNCNELPGAQPLPIQPISMAGGPKAASALALFQQGATSSRWLCINPVVLASSPPGSEMLVTGHVTNFLEPSLKLDSFSSN